MVARRAPGPRGPQAPRDADGARDHPRRRDDQRHLRPHGHDRQGVQRHLHVGRTPARTPSITGKSAFGSEDEFVVPPPVLGEPARARFAALPGVAAAEGSIGDSAQLTNKQGDTVGGGGRADPRLRRQPGRPFNPTELTTGTWADGDGEVVIDAATAEDEGYKVGDTIGIVTRGPVQEFTISGTAQFPGQQSLGGATFADLHARRGPAALRQAGRARRHLRSPPTRA